MDISFHLDKYLETKNFRVFIPETLFPLDLSPVKKAMRCPYPNCGNKLRISLDRRKSWCTSKMHPRFFINAGAIKIDK